MAGPSYHGRTHLPGGTDPIPGLTTTGGDGLEDVILAAGVDGFWKLNEPSGNTAFDSSGNGFDLTVPSGYAAPTWGDPAGPPGDQCAGVHGAGNNDHALRRTGDFDITGDLTAEIWAYIESNESNRNYLIGQGIDATGFNGTGWAMQVAGPLVGGGQADKLQVAVGDGTGNPTTIVANNALDMETWYHFAVTRDSGTWRMYVNGLLQADTTTRDPGSRSDVRLLNLASVSPGAFYLLGRASYAAYYGGVALSGATLLDHYERGVSGGALEAGLVWTSDGVGGASWQPSQIEVEF